MSSTPLRALAAAIFGSQQHPLAAWYLARLVAVAPLHDFTRLHQAKIRKKVRLATDPDLQRDLQCELAVAAVLAADRRSRLIYEPVAGRRGPDFLLCHKDHTDIYVEVSRLRPAQSADRSATERLAAVVCGKLGQLAAGAANLLVLVSDAGMFDIAAIEGMLLALRRHAAAGDDAYFAFRGLAGSRAFHQAIVRLSGLLVVVPTATDPLSQPYQARHALPADLARMIGNWHLSADLGFLPAPNTEH
ncbi:MAG TPA: hypothetical protein PKC19_18195 [Roseiflexaceae bacterium]|nr:hypothetical protein [Roseiflexaceae bacterium]